MTKLSVPRAAATGAASWNAHRILADLESRSLRRRLRRASGTGTRIEVDGREVLLLCGNDYLGLSTHPDVLAAAGRAAAGGAGSGASRLVSGTLPVHRELEEALAAWEGTEDAVLFSSGYAANLGSVPVLAGGRILSDRRNHASLIDGCRLARADVTVYPHTDLAAVEEALTAADPESSPLVVTDGVFSMDGDVCPVGGLARLCREHGARLYVDDAHGTGVLQDGRGTTHGLDVDYRMGTLSKALGAQGGFVAADRATCELLRNAARSFVFSTAPAPAPAAAALAALRTVADRPDLVGSLHRNAHHMRSGLRGLGLDVPEGPTPIIPVVVGPADKTMAMTEALLHRGVFVAGIRPPTVPEGTSRLRVTVMATHTRDDLDGALAAFEAAAREVGLWA